MIADEYDRKFISPPLESFLKVSKEFVMGWISEVECLDLKRGKHRFECRKITH